MISNALKFEAFHIGVKVHIPFLSKNRVSHIDRWSVLEEALHFLSTKEITSQADVLKQQVETMSCKPVGHVMVRAS